MAVNPSDRDRARGDRAAERVRARGGSAMDAALAAIEATFSPALKHSLAKRRVAALIRQGAAHAEVRARYQRLAERYPLANLDTAIAIVERLYLAELDARATAVAVVGPLQPPAPRAHAARGFAPHPADGAALRAGALRCARCGRARRRGACRAYERGGGVGGSATFGFPLVVIAGLDRAIPINGAGLCLDDRGGRVKPGDDADRSGPRKSKADGARAAPHLTKSRSAASRSAPAAPGSRTPPR